MNYQSTPRSNRPKGFMVKHWVQFALFAAFSLWLLYQIRQPAGNSGPAGQLSTNHVSDIMGRKGSAGLPKSTLDPRSGLPLEDVTNPVEEGEITRYSKELEASEFHTKAGSLENDNNTLSRGVIGRTDQSLTVKKSNISYPDENGIPQHVRDKFIGVEPKKVNRTSVKSQSQSQSQKLIATRVSNRKNGSAKES